MFFTRFVSLVAAIVVFITTYALVLPAITLEKTASCGIDEHQHDDSCYEYVLTCGQEESEGHHHDNSCYTVTRKLECQLEEHQHSPENGCYDEEGNLICQLEEHTHDDDCYSEVKELTCGREESEGHHHTDACYEKVLVCGKEVHTHSKECYTDDGDADGSNEEAADQASSVPMPDEAAGEQTAEAAAEENLSDNYVPELDPLNLEAVLGKETGFYYFHAEEGQEMPANSGEITDWQKVEEETELASTDLVKMYLPYTIPAGSLNETNPTARYRLPENIHLTDEQIDVINENENGIAAGYAESDPEYQKYLGAEAIEGDRTPDEILQEDAQEYISAVVKAENVYDVDGLYGEKGAYLGQDLIFTFVPYTIEKNQITYDAEQNVVSAGEKITGWFACDFRLDQIDWITEEAEGETEQETAPDNIEEGTGAEAVEGVEAEEGADGSQESVETESGAESENGSEKSRVRVIEKTAEVVFAEEDKENNIQEISRKLKLVEVTEDESTEDSTQDDDETDSDNPDIEAEQPIEDAGDYQSGTLTADGDGYRVTLDYTAEAKIPGNAELSVHEITAETDKEAYDKCLAQAEEHVARSADEKTGVDAGASRFFDIEILVKEDQTADSDEVTTDGTDSFRKIEPAAPVKVNIQILDASAAAEKKQQTDPTVLHFTEEGVEEITSTTAETAEEYGRESSDSGDSGNTSDEVSGSESNTAPTGSEAAEIQFEAESFSVYGVVYTVDFHWEVNGKMYEFSIPGGGFVSLEHLVEVLGIGVDETNIDPDDNSTPDENDADKDDDHEGETQDSTGAYDESIKLNEVEVSEITKKFVAEVESLTFSSPELVWVGKVNENSSVGALKEANGLEVIYSLELTEEQIAEINAQTVEAGDWGLISLQPFDTEESLTVTMKTGETFVIKVTDAKDAIVIDEDTGQIQTIPNPSGTTITMFDYWLNTEDAYARLGWPGYTGNGIQNGNNNWYYNNQQNNRHGGDNAGINNGHRLKFVPGADDSATDYWVTGGTPGYTLNGRVNGINSWNGTWNNSPVYTGEPTTGIVAGALYNGNNVDENGYPRLNNALGGESLGYLFDPGNNSASSYRRTYSGVNDFLYVDSQGYYTYDSQYYRVSKLDGTTNSFTVSEQPADNGQEGYLGFWPMGMRNYWFGMHLQTPFSIPVDGRVLNPKGEYKPMQFEFAGDDDAWVYIDGILVADGGGIHNRTELDINFQTGEVLVRGGTYTSITNPNTSVYSRSTIYQKFLDAKNRGDITQADWDAKYTNTSEKTVWVDTNNDGVFDTFAPGTKHTFDFFYLERGGAESNCYLRYNLITTTDFSAHKSHHSTDNPATTNVDESRLRRNQFKFELVGYDNLAYEEEGAEFVKAIMPDYITRDASKEPGTFENPLFNTVQASGTTAGYQSLIIGNTEDGNVNFGDKEISPSYAGKSYKYMVREVVPDNAVNVDNVRWADASEELRAEGGFALDGIMYDSRVYYFIGTVVETAPGSNEYKLSKERFFDPDCTQPDPANFHSFVNGNEAPVSLKINKKSDTETPLDGAVFSLTRAMQNADEKWVVREWRINNSETIYHSQPVTGTTSGGTLTFDNLTEGHYILEELQAPVGYQMGDQHRWLLTLEKVDATNKIQLVPYITPLDADGNTVSNRVPLDLPDENNTIEYEVLNGPLPPIDLSLQKKWKDNGDASVPEGAEATFELHRIKQASPTANIELRDREEKLVSTLEGVRAGDVIKIYDEGDDAFRINTGNPPNSMTVGMYEYWNGEPYPASRSENITPSDNNGWSIETINRYSSTWGGVALASSTSTSNGQYTVTDTDIAAGIIKLRLSAAYSFDKNPVMYISSHGSSSGSTPVDEVINTFTLKAQNGDGDAGNPWKKSFSELPLVDENGHPYSYYFKEVSHTPANYNTQTFEGSMGTATSPLTESGNVIVTNNAPELPKITASKEWLDENRNSIDAGSGLDGLEVKLTLYKGTSEAPAAEVKTGVVTRTVTGNGTATWYLLDEQADVSQYSVKETAVKIPGGDFLTINPSNSTNAFGGQVTGDSSNGFTVTNQLPKTEIEVTKQWKDGTSANADKVFEEAKTIGFSVYQKLGSNDGTPYEPEGQPVTGTVTYTPASGGTEASWSTETVSNLPKYVYSDGSWYEAAYYPVEDPAIDGVTVTYQKTGENAAGTPSDAAVPSGTVTIINTDIVFPIRIVKVDADNPQTGLSGAKFQLTRKLSGEGSFTKFVHSSFEEDADNDNKKTGLFTVSSTEGIILEGLLPGEYRIEEKKAPDGYIISLQPFTFTIDADGTVSTSDANSALVLHLDEEGDDPEGFQIGNTPGAALPHTGGPGTGIFTVFGSMLILGAAFLLWWRGGTI